MTGQMATSLVRSLSSGGILAAILLSGLVTAFLSQASARDYHALFWSIVPIACFHFLGAIIYVLRVQNWVRWIVLAAAALALLLFGEMAWRVWR